MTTETQARTNEADNNADKQNESGSAEQNQREEAYNPQAFRAATDAEGQRRAGSGNLPEVQVVGRESGSETYKPAYAGHEIRQWVAWLMYENTQRRSVKDIAAEHLGYTSEADRLKHAKEISLHADEIRTVNGLRSVDQMIPAGKKLELPGHSESGGFIRFDKNGLRHEIWPNGVEKVSDKDLTWGYHRHRDGSVKDSWGNIPEQHRPQSWADIKRAAQQANAERSRLPVDGNYTGHEIRQWVSWLMYENTQRRTVKDIAAEHLGYTSAADRASHAREIDQHAEEIKTVNRLRSTNDIIAAGRVLELPGHSDTGGFIRFDKNGLRHETWKNGVEKISDKDLTWGYHRYRDGSVKDPFGNIPEQFRPQQLPPPPKPVDRNQMEKAADAIEYACNGGIAIGTDKDTIYAILKDKSEAERKVIAEIYQQKYGHSLEEEFRDEMQGADLDKALNLLNRKDNDDIGDRADRIHTALIERDAIFFGRSDSNCEKDIRDSISTMNSQQIAELDQKYREKYGVGIRDALMQDKNLSQATKQSLDIYLKGTDKRTNEDTLKLADIAIGARSSEMFQEAMRNATPEARKTFMDQGGEGKLRMAFFNNSTELQHVLDYANNGRMSAATKVRDNTSWAGDNEQAIEQALTEMTADDRRRYLQGRDLANGKEVAGLTQEQREEALKYFRDTRAALEGAGNATEVAKWEDMIAVKGGSLVSRLADQKGFFNDDENGVYSQLENMPEEDWKRLKEDPNYRKEIENVLSQYLNDEEMARARQLLDAKQSAESFEQSKGQRRSVLQAIDDNLGTFNNDEAAIMSAIENMTEDEQKRYRENAEFRAQVDKKVADSLDFGAERDAATALLEKIRKGEKPTQGIIEKLNVHASDVNTDEAQVIRDLQEAFAKDPALHERITNPKTDEDRAFAERFKTALNRALDDSGIEGQAKREILQNGRISAELQMQFNAGVFDDDEQGYYKDLVALAKRTDAASVAEKDKILNDPEYREKVLSNLGEEERKVALNALQQGEMRPEDLIRGHMIGAGTGEEEIKEALKDLTPEQIEKVKQEYARKYGSDLTADMLSELGGQDARDVSRRVGPQPTTAMQAFDQARDEYYESRDGIGRAWVDNVWDGTGYMSDEAMNNFASAVSRSSAAFKELSPEEQKALTEQVQKNLDMFVQSKGAAADMAVDAVIIAAGIAAAKFTGGASLALLAKTALAGALFKVAAKGAIMGSDYDWASSQVVVDGLTGGIDAATIVLGPAQLAQVLKLGEKAAATATTKLLSEGGEQLIKAEMRDQVGKKMYEMIANSIANGAEGVDDKVITRLAKEFATEGNEQALAAAMKKSLQEGIEQESRAALKNTLTEIATKHRTATETTLNAASGAVGGGSSGAVRGLAEWDSSKSISENLQMVATQAGIGTLTGAGMAGVFTVGFKGLGSALRHGKELASGAHPHPTDVPVNVSTVDGQTAVIRAEQNPHLQAVQRADGSVEELAPGSSLVVKDGDVPIMRTDAEGRPLDAQGRPLPRDVSEYAVEASTPGDFDSMPAMNVSGLYGRTKFLPPGPRAKIGNVEIGLVGDTISIGRNNTDLGDIASNSKVSGDHGTLRYDKQSGKYYYTDHSTNGSYLRNPDGSYRRLPKGVEVELRPTDDLRLVGKDGPQVRVLEPPEEMARRLMQQPAKSDVVVQLGDQPLEFVNGKIELGRAIMRPDGQPLTNVDTVSSNHGTLRYDAQTKKYFYKDHSTNGSYILRAGADPKQADSWQFLKNSEVEIGPDDVVRLAKDGPQLKISSMADNTPAGAGNNVDIYIGDTLVPMKDGQPINIGRNHALGENGGHLSDMRVSGDHGSLRWNAEDGSFYLKDNSRNGTYVRKAGTDQFERVHHREVKIEAGDEIRLGSEDGPRVDLFAHNRAAGQNRIELNQVFINGKPVDGDLQRIEIGTGHQKLGPNDNISGTVSKDHGTLEWDAASGQFKYTDHSSNGTFIKRAGSDRYEKLHRGSTFVGPHDEIRLGSENGPDVKLTSMRGRQLSDGRLMYSGPHGNVLESPDGTTLVNDGIGIHRKYDANGRVTEVFSYNNNTALYGYDANGQLNDVQFSNGFRYTKQGSRWEVRSPDGQRTPYDGKISVEKDGSLRFQSGNEPPMIRRLDGSEEVIHANGRVEYRSADLGIERHRLNTLIENTFSNPAQRQRFQDLVNAFESRQHPPDEAAKFYHQINRLLLAGPEAPLAHGDRTRLAEQILFQAAHPTHIDQGANKTCNVTTIEHRVFAKRPSEAAALITDVATTGKYTAANGQTVDLSRVGGLRPDAESMRSLSQPFDMASWSDIKAKDGARTWASQIFENTAINIHWQSHVADHYRLKPGEVVAYLKETPDPNNPKDTGERLYKFTTDSQGVVKREMISSSPQIYADELTDVYNQVVYRIDGQGRMQVGADKGFVIGNKNIYRHKGPDAMVGVSSAKELELAVLQAQQQGGLPAVLMVHTAWPPFGNPNLPGSGGWHVVNIQGLRYEKNPITGKVTPKLEFTNQWGTKYDHTGTKAVDLETMYRSTIQPPAIVAEGKMSMDEYIKRYGMPNESAPPSTVRGDYAVSADNPNSPEAAIDAVKNAKTLDEFEDSIIMALDHGGDGQVMREVAERADELLKANNDPEFVARLLHTIQDLGLPPDAMARIVSHIDNPALLNHEVRVQLYLLMQKSGRDGAEAAKRVIAEKVARARMAGSPEASDLSTFARRDLSVPESTIKNIYDRLSDNATRQVDLDRFGEEFQQWVVKSDIIEGEANINEFKRVAEQFGLTFKNAGNGHIHIVDADGQQYGTFFITHRQGEPKKIVGESKKSFFRAIKEYLGMTDEELYQVTGRRGI